MAIYLDDDEIDRRAREAPSASPQWGGLVLAFLVALLAYSAELTYWPTVGILLWAVAVVIGVNWIVWSD